MKYTLLPRIGRLMPVLGVLGLAACEFPSEPPIFEQTWIVPADSVTVGVAELLPDSVAVAGGSFAVTTPSSDFDATLGQLCGEPECQVPGPVLVPNTPAFSYSGAELNSGITFPSEVSTVTVSGGTLQVQVTNNLGFDPLRPNGAGSAPYGQVVIGITSGVVSSNTVINGSPAQGLPNGAMTTLNVALPTGTYTSSMSIALTVTAPAGGPATIASGNTLSLNASVVGLTVSSATVVVTGKAVTTPASEFDLEEVNVGGIVQGGGLILEIVNPFTATANLDVRLAAPAQDGDLAVLIIKPITVTASGTSTANVTLDQAELQSLLGKTDVTIGVSGTASGVGPPGNTVTVVPTDKIIVRSKLSLTLRVGGDL